MKLIFEIERTDTFCGEANYSWAERHKIVVPENTTNLSLVRQAKKICGMNGVRSHTENHGDDLVIKFANVCQVIFVTFINEVKS